MIVTGGNIMIQTTEALLFQLEQQGFCCLYHNISSSNYHYKIVTGGNQENIELTMSEIAKKPAPWYTILGGRWSVPRSRGGDAHDDLRKSSPSAGFFAGTCGDPGSVEISIQPFK